MTTRSLLSAVVLCCFLPLCSGPVLAQSEVAERTVDVPVESRVPSWGIAITPDHEVYFADRYCDGGCIWKWTEKDGLVRVAQGRDASSLVFDDGYLYVPHIIPATVREDGTPLKSGAALYRIASDGTEETVIKPTPDPLVFSGSDFLIHDDGSIFFFHRGRLQRRDPNGETETFLGEWRQGMRDGEEGGEGVRFNAVRGMAWAPDGKMFIMDGQRLRRIDIDRLAVKTFARGLTAKVPDDPAFRGTDRMDWNRTYGITISDEGDLYLAYHGNRRLLRRRGRKFREVYHAPGPWSPVGVAVDGDVIYVLETAHSGERSWGPRIRRIANGRVDTIVTVD